MGNTKSAKVSARVDQLNEIAINATTKVISGCSTVASQQQLISVHNVSGSVEISGVRLKQGASVNMKCIMKTETQSKIQDEIASQISQSLANESIAALSALGGSGAAARTNIKNALANNMDVEIISTSVTESLQSQAIVVGNVGKNVYISDITMQQTNDIIAEAIIGQSSYSEVINDIATQVEQTATSKEVNPLQSLFDFLSTATTGWMLMIGAVVIAGIIGFVVFSNIFLGSEAGTALGKAAAEQIKQGPPMFRI